MGFNIGIIGLPNVGKSTLFAAVTKQQVEIANYPFATINPNVGVVEYKDQRVYHLQKIYNAEKIIFSTIKFVDIAGLVKGASKGKGLGNQFLANIREMDALCEVVRCFLDKDILHVEDKIDPVSDTETISLELVFADIDTLSKAEFKNKSTHYATDLEAEIARDSFKKGLEALKNGQELRLAGLTLEERNFLKKYNLLTLKPRFYLLNIDEKESNTPFENVLIKDFFMRIKAEFLVASLKQENLLAFLSSEEESFWRIDQKLGESVFTQLAAMGFKILNLGQFFTCGTNEIHSWSFTHGDTAKQCAGYIHSDIEKGYIRGEIFNYTDLLAHNGNLNEIRKSGILKIVGKQYVMNDGDICHFLFSPPR